MRRALWVVLAIALLARLTILLGAGPSLFYFEQTGQIHGSTAYDDYALNLLETGIYGREPGIPDAQLPPLYSYVLAAVYATVGRGGLQIGIFHTLLDLASIALLMAIARRLFASPEDDERLWGFPQSHWIATFAGAFFALYPYLIFQNLTLNDTALFIFLLHSFVYLLIVLRERETLDRGTLAVAVLAGIVLGITTLNRPLLPTLALLAAIWFLFRRPFWDSFRRLLPVAVVGVLVVTPWMIRSSSLYETFVPLALNSGENIYQGANPMTLPLLHNGYDVQWSIPPARSRGVDLVTKNEILFEEGIAYLRSNPDQIPALLWTKFLVHWSIDIAPRKNPVPGQEFALDENGELVILETGQATLQDVETIALYSESLFDRIGRSVHQLYFGSLLVLSVGGFVVSIGRWRDVSLLWFVQINMTSLYVLFHPSTRYRVPSDPLLFIFAACTIAFLFRTITRRKVESSRVAL